MSRVWIQEPHDTLVTKTLHTRPDWVCKVFVTISATLECFMLLIVVGTLRVPSLQTKICS